MQKWNKTNHMEVKTRIMFRYTSNVLIALLLFCSSCADRGPFTFVQLCDPQLGMGGYGHDMESFKMAVNQINALDPDFVIISGDLVHHANDSTFGDFLDIRELFEMPSYVAPGNHDVGNIPDSASLGYYRMTMGDDYYEFRHKGYSFIVANTQLWKVVVEKESERHDAWFRDRLADPVNEKRSLFVVGHHPLFVGQPDEEEEYFNIPPVKRAELLDLFVENNVVAYLSGHKHTTLINDYQGIQLVTGETTSKNFDNRPLGFRHWKVSKDTIQHHFVALEPVPAEPTEQVVH